MRGRAALWIARGLLALGLPVQAALTDLWWAGPQENGWGVSIVQHGETLFAVLYVYDDGRQPTWYVMSGGSWDASHTTYTGDVYAPHGASFFQYNAACFSVGASVGTVAFTFSGETAAILDYSIRGATGRKAISRQPFGPPAVAQTPGLADMWWGGPEQNGWGIAVLQQSDSLFAVWFTYDGAGMPRWFVMPEGAFTGPGTYEGTLYRTNGAAWLGVAYDASSLEVTGVGPYKLQLTGPSPRFEYTIDGVSGSMALARQPF